MSDLDLTRTLTRLDRNYEVVPELTGMTFPVNQQTKNIVSCEIEQIRKICHLDRYIESIALFMDIYSFEYSDVQKLLSTTMIEKITIESIKDGSLKGFEKELKCHDVTNWSSIV